MGKFHLHAGIDFVLFIINPIMDFFQVDTVISFFLNFCVGACLGVSGFIDALIGLDPLLQFLIIMVCHHISAVADPPVFIAVLLNSDLHYQKLFSALSPCLVVLSAICTFLLTPLCERI